MNIEDIEGTKAKNRHKVVSLLSTIVQGLRVWRLQRCYWRHSFLLGNWQHYQLQQEFLSKPKHARVHQNHAN